LDYMMNDNFVILGFIGVIMVNNGQGV